MFVQFIRSILLMFPDELLDFSTATVRVRVSPISASVRLTTFGESLVFAFGKHLFLINVIDRSVDIDWLLLYCRFEYDNDFDYYS